MTISKCRYLSAVSGAVLLTTPYAYADTDSSNTTETVVVTAAGYEQNIARAPATISVITAEDIEKKSYTDITDVLKNISGVQVSGGGVEQAIMIRGMSSSYTLFLIDGRPVQGNDAFGLNGAQAGTPINFLPPVSEIERIEVIRGPASALYGSDAMGGVINVITKKVGNEWSGSITTEYTMADSSNKVNEDSAQTSIALNAPLIDDTLSLQFSGSYLNQDESHFIGSDDSEASDPEYKRRNFSTKVNWIINDNNNLTMGYSRYEQERTHTPGVSISETVTNRDGSISDAEISYSKSIRDTYFIEHEAHYEGMRLKTFINYDDSENPSRVNDNTGNGIDFDVLTVNSSANWFWDTNTLTVGATYKNENLEDGATNGLSEPVVADADAINKMERYQYSIFAENEWLPMEDWSIVLSGRFDDNEAFGSHFSPKVYTVYGISDAWVLKGGVTSGYKAPSLRQSATDFGAVSRGGVIIGNPDLEPETSLNYEIGIAFDDVYGSGVSATLTAYLTEFEDKINRTSRICEANVECTYGGTTYPAHQYGYTAYENIAEAEMSGIEATLDYQINQDILLRQSYTFSETEQKSGEYKGEPLNDIAKHMYNASIEWQATEQLMLWTQGNYRSKTTGRWQTGPSGRSSNGLQIPAYTMVDLGLVYNLKKDINLKAGVYNAFNKEINPEEDENYRYILDGRKYNLALTMRF
ncbi:TonB-dependent receptor domain-containing protein [Vibrio olivae]|uniref:TonB-dependent receptor domain-containing protein n=1 Tax=Vibrio olivae TaxID=1243002 RepID=A0ABV5HP80_9VIBR